MISIGGINFVPKPSINVTPEYFYFGEDVIGGFVSLEVNGTHHASAKNDYDAIATSILNLLDTCAQIEIEGDCGGTLASINNSQGIIRDVRVSNAGSPLDLNYSIVLECTKGNNKKPLIPNQSSLPFSQLIDDTVMVRSYSETLNSNAANAATFSISSTNKLVKNPGKLTVQIEIGLYDNDQCDSNNIDYTQKISDFLMSRAQSLIDNPSQLKISTAGFTLCGTNAKQSLRKTGGSISFDLYMMPDPTKKAIVDFSETKETNQITGFVSNKIKGSILGIDSSKNILEPNNDGMANANVVYNLIKGYMAQSTTGSLLSLACGELPEYVPNLDGTCYILSNSRVSEFPTANRIEFELTYQDVEACELLGYKITAQYEERPSVKGRAEHFAPNRPFNYPPLTYHSKSVSAPKYKLTVTGEMLNTCAQHSVAGYSPPGNVVVDVVKTSVSKEFNNQKNIWKLASGNFLTVSRVENEGRYSFSITEEYVQCQ